MEIFQGYMVFGRGCDLLSILYQDVTINRIVYAIHCVQQLEVGDSLSQRARERVFLLMLLKNLTINILTVMKKTLIALLAMVGVAAAGTTSTITLNSAYDSPVIATSELSLENLTTIISGSDLRSALLGVTVVRNAGQEDEEKYPWSISANYWDPSNELHIYTKEAGEAVQGYADGSFSGSEGSWPTGHKLSNAFTLEGAVKGVITLGYAGDHATMELAGTAVAMSVLYEDGSVKSIYGLNTGYKYSNDSIAYLTYNSDVLATPTVTIGTDWTRDSLIAANKVALGVPEPTTATLGLLALAGLAARRRRK